MVISFLIGFWNWHRDAESGTSRAHGVRVLLDDVLAVAVHAVCGVVSHLGGDAGLGVGRFVGVGAAV